MKYFGSYSDDLDLVPKSYVDSRVNSIVDSILCSYDKYDINVAFRLKQYKNEKEQVWFGWDNYKNPSEVLSGEDDYVSILLNTDVRSNSILFKYDNSDPDLTYNNLPLSISGVQDAGGNQLFPTNYTIYYVLGIEKLNTGQDLFVYMRTANYLTVDHYKIRVLIPAYFDNSANGLFYNGKYYPGSDSSATTRNGYIDLGYYYDNVNGSNSCFLSASIHIYFDGVNYFIDRFSYDETHSLTS